MIEYTTCDCCQQALTEDGMRLGGKVIVSAKTCRNKACVMFEWTLNPEAHKAECASKKRGAA